MTCDVKWGIPSVRPSENELAKVSWKLDEIRSPYGSVRGHSSTTQKQGYLAISNFEPLSAVS